MFSKHEAAGALWVLTDNTPDAGWESLVCEAYPKRPKPNYSKPRWDLTRHYASEQEAIAGHSEIVASLTKGLLA